MADMDTYDDDAQGYEGGNYARNRSRSPVRERDDDTRAPEEPANGRAERDHPPERNGGGGSGAGGEAQNQGSNLFVTGIHPRLDETEVTRLFERYGEVEKCNIMKDPHTAESRGFGFVKMLNAEDAASAKDALSGFVVEGRTLSIEFARRSRPRTPTPGKYYGPPKRDDRPPRGGFRDDRGYGRRDDRRGGGGGYRDRYDDRGYSRRDDYAPRGGDRDRGDRDRYRSDRYDDRGSRSYGGGGGGYDRGDRAERAPRGPPADSYGGDSHARDAPPRDSYDRRGY